jgi:hypothetical protein
MEHANDVAPHARCGLDLTLLGIGREQERIRAGAAWR